MFGLQEVIIALTGHTKETPLVFTEAAVDSRQVLPGGLFVAVPGSRVDGHDFVPQAFRRGALAALVERDVPGSFNRLDLRRGAALPDALPAPPLLIRVENTVQALQEIARHHRSRLDVRVIGVTGSVGKSTTKEIIAEVLAQRYRTLKNPGNWNNEIGLPLSVLRLTPGHERAVLEMGFYVPCEIAFLCEIARPVMGVVTNIGMVHAERAGSQEDIARGKAELVQSLPPDGVAVLNYGDPRVRAMAEQTQAQVLFYGLNAEAHLWADEITTLGLEGIQMRLHYGLETIHLRVPLLGRHSVHTVLRAVAVGLSEGLGWPEIVRGLQHIHTQLRMVTTRTSSGALLIDDTYNASPQSMLAALNLLSELPGRKVAVLGGMLELGRYEKQGHEMVGLRAAEVADEVIAFGELARQIAESAMRGGMAANHVHMFDDLDGVVAFLKETLQADDVVLVKGSHGLQMNRIVAALEAGA